MAALGSSLVFSEPTPQRVLALGDSYTVGQNVDEHDRWPVQLARIMDAGGLTVETPQIIAKTGWTTAELRDGIARAKPKGPFDFVTLLIGVNDQYRGYTSLSYRREFTTVLKQAITYAGDKPSRVIVVSIPDWGATPFAQGQNRRKIAKEIDEFNAINRELATAFRTRYVDVTALSREVASKPELLAADDLHPSAKMYEQWAQQVYQEIKKELP